MPQCIQSLFQVRENKKNLRGKNKLVLPAAETTTYGLKSTSYITAKAWNALPDKLRSIAEFGPFRNEIIFRLKFILLFFFFVSVFILI